MHLEVGHYCFDDHWVILVEVSSSEIFVCKSDWVSSPERLIFRGRNYSILIIDWIARRCLFLVDSYLPPLANPTAIVLMTPKIGGINQFVQLVGGYWEAWKVGRLGWMTFPSI